MHIRTSQILPVGRHRLVAVVLLCLCLMMVGVCVRAEDRSLVIEGSTSILPIAVDVGEEFIKKYPDVNVRIRGGGSIAGFKALISGDVDIAMSSTFISGQELQLAQQRNVYPVPFRIAYDCILPIVNRGLPIREISQQALKNIYLGRIDNWKQLDGPDLAIKAVSRDIESGTYKVWHQTIMNQEDAVTGTELKHSSSDVVEIVSKTPGAIGYIGLSYLNAQVVPLKVEGVIGSTHTLRNGTYPIGRPLFMFTNGWPEGNTLAFINFVLNPEQGQVFIDEAGYIPLH